MEFVELQLRDVSFEDVTMDFEFLVSNPNDVSLSLKGLDYKLELDGKSLVSGETEQDLRLEAKGSAPVRLPLTITFTDFVDNLATFFSSRTSVPYLIDAGFGLSTPIGALRVPVRREGEMPLPKPPEIQAGEVRLAEMSLVGAKVEFVLDVRNRGAFPLSPEGLSYNIALAGVSVTSGKEALPPLEANGTQRITLPVEVSFLRLGAAVVQAIRQKSLPYTLEGNLDLGLFNQPFKLNGTAQL